MKAVPRWFALAGILYYSAMTAPYQLLAAAPVCRHLGNSENSLKRSINLALSYRGERALETVGLLDAVMKECVPMYGRAIHTSEGLHHQPYGEPGQHINSISRSFINCILLDELDRICAGTGRSVHATWCSRVAVLKPHDAVRADCVGSVDG